MTENVKVAAGGLRNEKKKENTPKQRKKKKIAVLQLPYSIEWPSIKSIHQSMILSEFTRTLQTKLKHQSLLQKYKRIKDSVPADLHDKVLKKHYAKHSTVNDSSNIEQLIKNLYDDSLVASCKPYFVLGVGEVTKYLERGGNAALLVVCASADPPLMTSHLLCACVSRDIAACQIEGLGASVAAHFGTSRLLALLFKEVADNPFASLIEFIKDKIPHTEPKLSELYRSDKRCDGPSLPKKIKTDSITSENDSLNTDKKNNVSTKIDFSKLSKVDITWQ